jgi:hypothetical protein
MGKTRGAKKQAGASPSAPADRVNWRNRIVGYAEVDPRKLKANPLNWRQHPKAQKRAMGDVLEQLGVIDAVLVNKTTGNVLDGHMRHEMALEEKAPTVPVLYVQLSIDEEKLALSVLNPLADLAVTDPEKLGALLAGVDRKGGPLDELLAALEEQAGGAIVRAVAAPGAKRAKSKTVTHTMRIMLAVPNVGTIEKAIAATGITNRGDALLAICERYLMGSDDDKAQRDGGARSSGGAASELDQAFAGASIGGDGNTRADGPTVRSRLS